MTRYLLTLCPNDFDRRQQALKLDEQVWKVATEVVRRRGFTPNTFAGLDRLSTKLFAQALGQALEQESVPADAHDALCRLHDFMTGPGVGGFGISRARAW